MRMHSIIISDHVKWLPPVSVCCVRMRDVTRLCVSCAFCGGGGDGADDGDGR